eukprot:scaffold130717_cov66-Phaeocystis_antarctica.AAC.2
MITGAELRAGHLRAQRPHAPPPAEYIYRPKALPPKRTSRDICKAHAMRTRSQLTTLARQTGHSRSRAEQAPQAHWWPHGAARCDFGLTKQIMHVVWPPMVDSGASGRPVSNCALESDVTAAGSDGCGSSSTGTAAAPAAATRVVAPPATAVSAAALAAALSAAAFTAAAFAAAFSAAAFVAVAFEAAFAVAAAFAAVAAFSALAA